MVQCPSESIIYPILQLFFREEFFVGTREGLHHCTRTPGCVEIPRNYRRPLHGRNIVRVLCAQYRDIELLYNTTVWFHYFQYTVVQVPP